MRKTDGVDNKTGSGDLPVGLFVEWRVKLFFGFSEKYFCFHEPQINSRTFRIPPHQRGVSRSSRTRGGMRWTRQRFARDGIAGRVERLVSDQQRADERCCSVRRSRVVLTPRRWRQVLRRLVRLNRAGQNLQSAGRRWQKSPIAGESTKETVKTIACGNVG